MMTPVNEAYQEESGCRSPQLGGKMQIYVATALAEEPGLSSRLLEKSHFQLRISGRSYFV